MEVFPSALPEPEIPIQLYLMGGLKGDPVVLRGKQQTVVKVKLKAKDSEFVSGVAGPIVD